MVDWRLRLRAVLTKQFTVLLVVLLIVALAGGWMTYSAYVKSQTTTDQETTA